MKHTITFIFAAILFSLSALAQPKEIRHRVGSDRTGYGDLAGEIGLYVGKGSPDRKMGAFL